MTSRSNTRFRRRLRCRPCRNKAQANRRNGGTEISEGAFSIKNKKARPICPTCGSEDVADITAYQRKHHAKQTTCTCASIPFRHRKGSLRFCIHHPSVFLGLEPTEDEIQHHEAMCAKTGTPDSASGVPAPEEILW